MKVIWTNPALKDLEAILDYIALENPIAAYEVATSIQLATEKLADFPDIGRQGRVANTRELILPDLPYVLPYEVCRDTEEVYVLTVFHTDRKWPE
jgi:addiction module RelE/StbE family toxin